MWKTKLYYKRDDFSVIMVTFHLYVAPFRQYLHMEYTYISAFGVPEHAVSTRMHDVFDRLLLVARKLLNPGFLVLKKSSLRKFYGRHHDLVKLYGMYTIQSSYHLSPNLYQE